MIVVSTTRLATKPEQVLTESSSSIGDVRPHGCLLLPVRRKSHREGACWTAASSGGCGKNSQLRAKVTSAFFVLTRQGCQAGGEQRRHFLIRSDVPLLLTFCCAQILDAISAATTHSRVTHVFISALQVSANICIFAAHVVSRVTRN